MARPAVKTKYILDAARSLFSERGFHNVTLKEIADRAGVSQGLIIHHYATLEGLYNTVVDEMRPHTANALMPKLQQFDTPTKEQLVALLTAYVEHRVAESPALKILDWARLEGDVTRSPEEDVFLKTLAECFARAQEASVIRDDIEPDDMILMTAATVQHWIRSGSAYGPTGGGTAETANDRSAKSQQAIVDLIYKTVFMPRNER
ncbi:MAG: TetR/AcrR family transcriptional regulator [Pseudomonadota bacterium]